MSLTLHAKWVSTGATCAARVPFRVIVVQNHGVIADIAITPPACPVKYLEAVQGTRTSSRTEGPLSSVDARERVLAVIEGTLTPGVDRYSVAGYNLMPLLVWLGLEKGNQFPAYFASWDARDELTAPNPLYSAFGGDGKRRFSLQHLVRELTPKMTYLPLDFESRALAIAYLNTMHRLSIPSNIAKLLTKRKPESTPESRCGYVCEGVCVAWLGSAACDCMPRAR